MRGKYHMMDWEIEKWRTRIFHDIEKLLCGIEEKIDYSAEDICPHNIETILTEHLDYVLTDEEANNHDLWFNFENPNTKVHIVVFVDVMSLEFGMYLTERED
jgi:hypothetical protein